MLAINQRPVESVVAVFLTPVVVLVTVTLAPGIIAPCESVTVAPNCPGFKGLELGGGAGADTALVPDFVTIFTNPLETRARLSSPWPTSWNEGGSRLAASASPPKSLTLYCSGRNTSHCRKLMGTSILGRESCESPFLANGAPECINTKETL